MLLNRIISICDNLGMRFNQSESGNVIYYTHSIQNKKGQTKFNFIQLERGGINLLTDQKKTFNQIISWLHFFWTCPWMKICDDVSFFIRDGFQEELLLAKSLFLTTKSKQFKTKWNKWRFSKESNKKKEEHWKSLVIPKVNPTQPFFCFMNCQHWIVDKESSSGQGTE